MNTSKMIVAALVAVMSLGAFAAPHGGHDGGRKATRSNVSCHERQRNPPPRSQPRHHHDQHDCRDAGQGFVSGLIGGLIGGAIANAIAPEPVVAQPTVVVAQPAVTTPVAVTKTVWVDGYYMTQVLANGTVAQVWQPGHYEQQTVMY